MLFNNEVVIQEHPPDMSSQCPKPVLIHGELFRRYFKIAALKAWSILTLWLLNSMCSAGDKL